MGSPKDYGHFFGNGTKLTQTRPSNLGNFQKLEKSRRKLWKDAKVYRVNFYASRARLGANKNFILFGPNGGRRKNLEYFRH